MTELNVAARARILASKAEFQNEAARVEKAALSIQQEKDAASFNAGREWAMNGATYKEIRAALTLNIISPIQTDLDKKMCGHSRYRFLDGVKSVLDEANQELPIRKTLMAFLRD